MYIPLPPPLAAAKMVIVRTEEISEEDQPVMSSS